MRRWQAIVLGGILALTGVPALAQTDDGPIPRTYPESTAIRARPDQPADEAPRQAAEAEAAANRCAAGDFAGCTAVAEAHHYGRGRPQNRPVAELLYRRACNAADAEGCYGLGQLLRSTRQRHDAIIANAYFVRACRLGALEACVAEADDLASGITAPSDRKAADALRRATCAKGSASACRTLAELLVGQDRSAAEQAEGLALLDRMCRRGDKDACRSAIVHWRDDEDSAQADEYRRIGCAAGDAWPCTDLGHAELRRDRRAPARERALVFYDRACTLAPYYCQTAADIRAIPALNAACAGGERAACIAAGKIYSQSGGPLEDRVYALTLLGPACDTAPAAGDAAEVCELAAFRVFDVWRATGIPDPVRAEAFLSRACDAGSDGACSTLAEELMSGTRLPADPPRALELTARLCDGGDEMACKSLERAIFDDPATPLVLAGDSYVPELTPEEAAAQQAEDDAEEERAEAEYRARICTTTTVIFAGVSYTDTLCDNLVRVRRGFMVEPGAAPWQALIWRPAMRGRSPLSDPDRVLCGGSVIREGWILTAAHCVNDKHMGGVSIRTGGHVVRLGMVKAFGNDGLSYPIIATFRHPDYDPASLAFDIALVQYDPGRGKRGADVLVPARIRLDPVPLHARKVETLGRVVTYGWGLTAVTNGTIPDRLRGGRVKLRDLSSCTAEIVSFADRKRRVTDPAQRFDGPVRRDSVLCADEGRDAEGGQACSGDSGGPLVSYSDADKIPTLIGVVSGGVKCGTTGRPSRFIRVAHQRVQSWLKATLPPVRR